MSGVARFLLGWTAISAVVSPFVGMLLRHQQLDLAVVSPVRRSVTTSRPVPAR